MGSTKAQIKASEKWLKEHGNERYDRVQLVFPKGFKAKAATAAEAKGLSLSAYVLERLRSDRKQRINTQEYYLHTVNADDDLRKGIIMRKIIFNCVFGLEEDVMALAPFQNKEIEAFEKATGKTFPQDVYAEMEVSEDEAGEDGSISEETDQKHFEILKEDILRQMKELGIDEKYLTFTCDTGCEDEDDEE